MTEDSDYIASPEARLFRQPPDRITVGCAAYMDRVQELREFMGAFFAMVKAFGPLTNAMRKAAPEHLASIREGTVPMLYYYSVHRQYVNEVALSRSVESFDLYVLTTLRAIFRARPEMLKSEASIDVATIVELRNSEDILTYVAERRLHDLSFKPLSELSKFIESRTGIALFVTPDIYSTVLLASEVRNLVAHNDCVVNDIFRRRVGDALPASAVDASGKFSVSDEWMRVASYTLDAVVFDFDVQVSTKFNIPTIDSSTFKGTRVESRPAIEALRLLPDDSDPPEA